MADTADMVEDTVVVMDIRAAAATVVTVAAMAVIHISTTNCDKSCASF